MLIKLEYSIVFVDISDRFTTLHQLTKNACYFSQKHKLLIVGFRVTMYMYFFPIYLNSRDSIIFKNIDTYKLEV